MTKKKASHDAAEPDDGRNPKFADPDWAYAQWLALKKELDELNPKLDKEKADRIADAKEQQAKHDKAVAEIHEKHRKEVARKDAEHKKAIDAAVEKLEHEQGEAE